MKMYDDLMNCFQKYHECAEKRATKEYVREPLEGVTTCGEINDSDSFDPYQKVARDFIGKVLGKDIPDLLKGSKFHQNSDVYDQMKKNGMAA